MTSREWKYGRQRAFPGVIRRSVTFVCSRIISDKKCARAVARAEMNPSCPPR